MEKQEKVLWSKTAYKALEKHCNHIQKESLQSTIKVKSEIIAITKSLANTPTRYPLVSLYYKKIRFSSLFENLLYICSII